MTTAAARVSFLAAGDCGPVHGPNDGIPMERYTELVRPTLASVDLRFVNCERQYSTRGSLVTSNPHGCQPPEMAKIFDDCRFDVANLANNHMWDFGPDALLDTRALLLSKGIAVTGAGKGSRRGAPASSRAAQGHQLRFPGLIAPSFRMAAKPALPRPALPPCASSPPV